MQDDKPLRVDAVVLACQHTEDILDKTGKRITEKAKQEIIKTVAHPVVGKMIDKNTKFYVNETGKFVVGGPHADTGVTGRKIIVDTYGGVVPHGGGLSPAKTQPRWTVPRLTWRAIFVRILLPPALPGNVCCRSAMP